MCRYLIAFCVLNYFVYWQASEKTDLILKLYLIWALAQNNNNNIGSELNFEIKFKLWLKTLA